MQLALPDPALNGDPVDRWWALPEPTRGQVLRLLAALIARGVLVDVDETASSAETLTIVEVAGE